MKRDSQPIHVCPRVVRVPPAFYAFCVALVLWGLWACARIHARTNPLKIRAAIGRSF